MIVGHAIETKVEFNWSEKDVGFVTLIPREFEKTRPYYCMRISFAMYSVGDIQGQLLVYGGQTVEEVIPLAGYDSSPGKKICISRL